MLKTSLALADLAFDVLLENGINITPTPVWMDDWEHPQPQSTPRLLANIGKDGVRFGSEVNGIMPASKVNAVIYQIGL